MLACLNLSSITMDIEPRTSVSSAPDGALKAARPQCTIFMLAFHQADMPFMPSIVSLRQTRLGAAYSAFSRRFITATTIGLRMPNAGKKPTSDRSC
ncbi:hypothetical protein F7P84_16365 [Edwardsiella anguillarum]|nr:hypothetical protein F7P84_16365 [Edwardsiella anguillarum]